MFLFTNKIYQYILIYYYIYCYASRRSALTLHEKLTTIFIINTILFTRYSKYTPAQLKSLISTLILNIAGRQRNDRPINISIFKDPSSVGITINYYIINIKLLYILIIFLYILLYIYKIHIKYIHVSLSFFATKNPTKQIIL